MTSQIPLADRLRKQEQEKPFESLPVLSRRLPLYFQGVAALTGQRCQRENIACWQRWEEGYYQENFSPGKPDAPVRQEQPLAFWFAWACIDLIQDGDAEMFTRLILEPMYWLSECRKAQEGD